MVARRWVAAVILLGALASLAAEFRTRNFVVTAADAKTAKHIAEWAEHHRKQKAIEWLGQEMPPWGQPCPLVVKVSYNGSGGATTFAFDRGRILSMNMEIEGTLERLTYSVLPHEVTHTVFGYHFRQPVPRWADEGGSVLSEDDQERARHDTLVRQILNTPGRMIPLRRLFSLTQYPRDVMVLYAEGYSVTNFLVGQSSRQEFLNFVADGMRLGWDQALQAHYRYRSVDELEQAWIAHLRDNKKAAATTVASAAAPGKPATATPASRVVSRQTLPPSPIQVGAPRPVARGVAKEEEDSDGFATPFEAPPSDLAHGRPPVKLGAPRPPAPGNWARPPATGSPVGFPN
jgi:hypothetical protein